ncbi:MAG: hypothetical protein AMJ68_04620 [Acidithiobacillales bacterium SG8_45]|jgi:hypothetical protein|nr:MAG: hypothetical protein AMJ68_04620 [Acidithiobacillales bacterium SG8_45]
MTGIAGFARHLVAARLAGGRDTMTGIAGTGRNSDMTEFGREPGTAYGMARLTRLVCYRVPGGRFGIGNRSVVALDTTARQDRDMIKARTGPDNTVVTEITWQRRTNVV